MTSPMAPWVRRWYHAGRHERSNPAGEHSWPQVQWVVQADTGGNVMSDKGSEAERLRLRILGGLTGEQRLRTALEMSDLAKDLCRARLRLQHPDWTEEQITRELVRYAFAPAPSPWRKA